MDPFKTLGLPRCFDVDMRSLALTHRQLSRTLHPDRYVGAGASERHLALERAVQVNEAFRAVRDPLRRAEALFSLAGVPVGEANEPRPSPGFLMDLMELREELAVAMASKDLAAIRRIKEDMSARQAAAHRELGRVFALAPDGGEARAEGEGGLGAHVGLLGELRFYGRILEEVGVIEEELSHAS